MVEVSSAAGSGSGGGDRGGLVEQVGQVSAESAVVEPDDQAQTGVEAAGGEGRVDDGLVVAMDEREGVGPHDTGLSECLFVEDRRLEDADGRFRVRVGGPVHDRLHAGEQSGGRRPSLRAGSSGAGTRQRRHDDGDPRAVQLTQLGGEVFGEGVVAAHHHVAGSAGCRVWPGSGGTRLMGGPASRRQRRGCGTGLRLPGRPPSGGLPRFRTRLGPSLLRPRG